MSSNPNNFTFLRDPLVLGRVLWPHVNFYDRQRELIYSVWHNKLTICVAGNMLGKDFTAAFIALAFFLTRTPCRVITTSVDGDQLAGVLWGEMRRLIQDSKYPLNSYDGGPLLVNDLYIRKVNVSGPKKGELDALSYIIGKVAKKGEGMLGHHIAETGDGIPRVLFMGDEASGLEDETIDKAETCYDRGLLIGNAYPCTNRFYRESEPDQGGGDKPSGRRVRYWEGITLDGESNPPKYVDHYLRKVIRIPCSESPNVKAGQLLEAKGRVDDIETKGLVVPGVMSYWKYKERRAMWDEVKQCIQLDAQFYKGGQLLLFPPNWLQGSAELESTLPSPSQRTGKAISCDPGEGEAESAFYVVDDDGILEEVAKQTPDTTDIPDTMIHLMRKWRVEPEMCMLDRGGGGKQHADYLRRMGYNVKTVAFGEAIKPPVKRGLTPLEHQVLQREEAYAYVNRRAELFHQLSILLDPALGPQTDSEYDEPIVISGGGVVESPPQRKLSVGRPRFCIPEKYTELRRQLAPFPKMYDKEGRYRLPPKNKQAENSKEKTLVEMIGCSPDRADALVIAVYCRDYSQRRIRAGAA